MKRTYRPPHPLWTLLTLLVLAALACNLGTRDNVDIDPTTPPRDRATATDEIEEEPTEEPEEEPTEAPTDEPNNNGNQGNGLSRNQRSDLIAATVQIFGLFEQGNDLMIGYTGSGTIISEDGLILTNAHVASPAAQGNTDFEPDALAVALVEAEDEPPVASYFAEVRAVDGYMDLAVIQIVATLDGDEIDPDDLDLPYVKLGDSDEVRVGDHVNIFGFPGIGGDTLTFTDGNVSGFTAEAQLGNRAWIKTDATIAGGNSGGLAAGDDASIIGVPSRAGTSDNSITDCRVVEDTNGDGVLNGEDNCVPIGGFINGLRPINLALPLIDAAQRGLDYDSPYEQTGIISGESSGEEAMSDLTWYTVSDDGELEDPVESYPSGTSIVAAVFDFSGMTDGQEWGESWTLDGEEVYSASYAWDQGEEGTYLTWLSRGEGNELFDGDYHVELYAGSPTDGTLLTEGDVTIGGEGGEDNGNEDPLGEGEVQLFGYIYDGDTNRVLPGAQFIVLMPGVTYAEWDGSEDEVYTWAEADEEGFYVLPDLLVRDTEYTVVVGAKGYATKYGDALVWTDEDPDEYQLDVGLAQ